ncbi:hypothetical protein P280DRAFT_296268 [Massarina eburnea CBS 473.64]|uniref:Transmembrane protein n=1 Tax=Massarina eburnea CBS 473.64 TaxID=1395130 RepID=A0A6A6S4Z8_9PLEO|nr:hypothetical protein P280DRAFT_296268 [Massarina eburnea CBS 473.64]
MVVLFFSLENRHVSLFPFVLFCALLCLFVFREKFVDLLGARWMDGCTFTSWMVGSLEGILFLEGIYDGGERGEAGLGLFCFAWCISVHFVVMVYVYTYPSTYVDSCVRTCGKTWRKGRKHS